MFGFLNLNKPFGFTSHDCVAKTRRLLKLKRIGHAGTLDPAATGVLPIAVGKATRLLQFLRQDKAYRATMRLGVSTTTDDMEGEVLLSQPLPDLTLDEVKSALQLFEGKIQQIPPAYSAVQVQGKRLYDLARKGEEIAVQPRSVEVFKIEVLDWRSGEFPEIDVAIACGPGTYIRAIARDLGKALKTGGTLASLLRTTSSGFDLHNSLTFEAVEAQIQAGTLQLIVPELALTHLPAIVLPADIARRWCQGQKILTDELLLSQESTKGEHRKNSLSLSFGLRVCSEQGDFLGIGQLLETEVGTVLAPQVVLETAP